MKIKSKFVKTKGIKFYIEDKGKEIARAYLYLIKNDFRKCHYGFIEDVYVEEEYRHQGLSSNLHKELIKAAKKNKCYKIVANSRYSHKKVHQFYKKLGFKDFGKEFKMYLEK